MCKWFLFLNICLGGAFTGSVQAHSGGLDSSGCHSGSQPYHCHRTPSEMVGNRLRCDLGSRSVECLDYTPPISSGGSDPHTADLVANALLEAAAREPDPEIRQRLLEEYERIVGSQ